MIYDYFAKLRMFRNNANYVKLKKVKGREEKVGMQESPL